MITRIDLPVNSAQFTPSDGVQPYNSKYSIPISRLYYADTPFTVQSLGLKAYWFNNANNWSNTSFAGTIPGGIVKFWWDYGYPEQITVQENNRWGLLCTGWFKPEYNGLYRFYAGGQGELHYIKLNSSFLSLTTNSSLSIDDNDLKETSDVSLSSSTWYPFSFRYKSVSSVDKVAGFSLLYKRVNDDLLMPEKVVMSAGVTSYTQPSGNYPIPLHTVLSFKDVQVKYDDFGAQSLSFNVPFVSSSSSYLTGGYSKWGEDSYWDISDTAHSYILKRFRMIKYYEGYRNSLGQDELVQKFSGRITNFSIKYGNDGNDTLEITCESPINLLRTQYAEYVPSPIDYITSGYMSEITSHVNGRTKPRCYDGWEVYKIFQNLLLNAYIDPTLFYKKKEFNSFTNTRIAGDYKIAYTGNSQKLYVNRQLNYGNVGNVDSKPDDKYLYIADTGEYYYDIINKIIEPYLFRWGFDRIGEPFLTGVDVPYIIKDDQNFTYTAGTWTNKTGDFNTIKAIYKQTPSKFAQATCDALFSRADLILRVGPNTGLVNTSATMITAHVYHPVSMELISSTSFNPYYPTAWSYYMGPDPNTGVNPCIFNLASGLKFDKYRVYVNKNTSTGFVNLDGMLLYDTDINSPAFKFYTGDTISPGQIAGLDIDEEAQNIRNTCVVFGKRTGTKSGYKDDSITTDVNPNNPISTFYSSKVIDLNSISSPSASNFVGLPLKTIIVEPNITSQDQADFIAFEYVKNNRISHSEVNFMTVGNPLIEVNDCVNVIDTDKSGITENKKMWISGVENQFNENGYITKFSAIDIKPFSSYTQKPNPDLSFYGNNPIQNVKIYNGGVICNLTSGLNSGVTSEMSVNGDLQYVPQKGYLKLISGVNEEIIKYTSIQRINGSSGKYIGLTRGLQATNAKTFPSNSTVIGAWDPYTQDGMGIVPVVTFDLIADGKVEVIINGFNNGIQQNVARLTNQFANNFPYDGYNELTWGAGKYFTWNGNDDFGIWNTYYGLELPQGSKSGIFVTEPIINGVKQKYGIFVPQIIYRGESGTTSYPISPSVASKIYTRRGETSVFTFKILDKGMYELVENSNGTWSESQHTETGASTRNLYIKSGSNNGEMIHCNIKDISSDINTDSDYKRLNRFYLISKFEKFYGFSFMFKTPQMDNPIHLKDFNLEIGPGDGRIIFDGKDYIEDMHKNGNGINIKFNPELSDSDLVFTFNPPQEYLIKAKQTYQNMKEVYTEVNPRSDFILLMPFVTFHGYIVDKSGRKIDSSNGLIFLREGYNSSVSSNILTTIFNIKTFSKGEKIYLFSGEGMGIPYVGWSYTQSVRDKIPVGYSRVRESAATFFYNEVAKKFAGEGNIPVFVKGLPVYLFSITSDNF